MPPNGSEATANRSGSHGKPWSLLRVLCVFAVPLLAACQTRPPVVTPTAPPPPPTITRTPVPLIITSVSASPTSALPGSETPAPQFPGMVFVSGGPFNLGDAAGADDAKPEHSVTLAAFWIDQYEVTNQRYVGCVSAGACDKPYFVGSATRGDYFDNPAYANYPVVGVFWRQAEAFCAWEGKRLPTEAEWERAARGSDGRRYPWGSDFDAALVPADQPDTVAVGSYPGNQSPFGAFDMAGNAAEWVRDYYSATYYGQSEAENPTGPPSGGFRVYRGGSYASANPEGYTATRRARLDESLTSVAIGFRCAISAQ